VAKVIHDTEAKPKKAAPTAPVQISGRAKKAKVPKTAVLAAKVERRRTDARRCIYELPHDLAPELAGVCLDASRRIRLERQVAYARPVVLERDVGELTLLPITRSQTRCSCHSASARARRPLKENSSSVTMTPCHF